MSDTPRTDEFTRKMLAVCNPNPYPRAVEFARQLERELSERKPCAENSRMRSLIERIEELAANTEGDPEAACEEIQCACQAEMKLWTPNPCATPAPVTASPPREYSLRCCFHMRPITPTDDGGHSCWCPVCGKHISAPTRAALSDLWNGGRQ